MVACFECKELWEKSSCYISLLATANVHIKYFHWQQSPVGVPGSAGGCVPGVSAAYENQAEAL